VIMAKLISIDFDDTLYFNKSTIKYNKKLIKFIKSYNKVKYDFIIVTARNEEYDNFAEMKIDDFIETTKLPIQNVYFTDGADKGSLLKKLHVNLHIDNDLDQIKSCKENDINVIYLRRF
tara:strand:+ start:413 stop:769 length:357 start_codon:yes stop_codon:yes gene_type:complete